jgi:hypothetical protein
MLAEGSVTGRNNVQELRPYLSPAHTGYTHTGMERYKQKNRQQSLGVWVRVVERHAHTPCDILQHYHKFDFLQF